MNLFTELENSIFEERLSIRHRKGKDLQYINCLCRKRDILVKPEEIVRQKWIARLHHSYHYPFNRIRVEHPVHIGSQTKSADIAILDEQDANSVYAIVEVKKEKRRDGKGQLKSYCDATGAQIGIWSNGQDVIFWNRKNPNYFVEIPDMPRNGQNLEDIIRQPWTIDTLIEKEKERERENKALRDLITDLEDEVLSNAGVDVFEEIFKLIFIKMYDEVNAILYSQNLQFRNTNSDAEFFRRIDNLFTKAKEKWPNVFSSNERINLDVGHLRICVGSLESWKLFNSNMDVIDDAFEYLVAKSARGEKGQYFTPRWVIDMCVKMLDPKENETIIDPACGSAGFLIHSAFHNWKRILLRTEKSISHLFSGRIKPQECIDYVARNVFGIDFDDRVVRVARCINLIAGDGHANVLRLNSIDWKSWQSVTEEWRDAYAEGWRGLRKMMDDPHKEDYRSFKFDVCLANPPFSGSIKDSKILSPYNIAVQGNGKKAKSMDRDILFVERCIDLIKPGGRIAIVLPEGRFNNPGDETLRKYIMDRCRVLAVVSLHPNTFRPHTGIRTGVLFLQKWNDKPEKGPLCKKQDNYEIFFAIQQIESVSNKGAKIYVRKSNNDGYIRDNHGHLIVDHDLFNHSSQTENGIAEAFGKWAKKQKLSFVNESGSMGNSNRAKTFMGRVSVARNFGRIDPKSFAPECMELRRKIKRNSDRIRSIGEFAVYNSRGVQPQFIEGGDIEVIRSGNILEGYLDYAAFGSTSKEVLDKNCKAFIEDNDILIYTTGANIGRTAIYSHTPGSGGGANYCQQPR